jgi:hypothetical protein
VRGGDLLSGEGIRLYRLAAGIKVPGQGIRRGDTPSTSRPGRTGKPQGREGREDYSEQSKLE